MVAVGGHPGPPIVTVSHCPGVPESQSPGVPVTWGDGGMHKRGKEKRTRGMERRTIFSIDRHTDRGS